jgi:hypothetical protein
MQHVQPLIRSFPAQLLTILQSNSVNAVHILDIKLVGIPMQPQKASLNTSFAIASEPASASLRGFRELIAEVQTEQHPAIKALRQIIDQPGLHSVGDLAVSTERLAGELMLFSALVGGPLAHFGSHGSIPIMSAPSMATSGVLPAASETQAALHAEFVRDLEG